MRRRINFTTWGVFDRERKELYAVGNTREIVRERARQLNSETRTNRYSPIRLNASRA